MNLKLILPAAAILLFGCEKQVDPECKGEPIADCNCYMLMIRYADATESRTGTIAKRSARE